MGKGRTAGDEQTGRQEELGEQSCPAKEGELHPDGARIPQRVLSRGVTGFTCTLDGSAQPMLPRRHFSDWSESSRPPAQSSYWHLPVPG